MTTESLAAHVSALLGGAGLSDAIEMASAAKGNPDDAAQSALREGWRAGQ